MYFPQAFVMENQFFDLLKKRDICNGALP